MASRASGTDFRYFSSLPPELRQLIWKESVLVSMENPEVLILVPRHVRFGKYATPKSSPFPPVNTGFPVALHVNREARFIALMHINMVDLSPYPWQKCLVPQRPFRPEIDTLYASRTTDPHEEYLIEELAEVRHLALDYTGNITTDMLRLFRSTVNLMPALRSVCFVLPRTQINLCDGSDPPLLPHRRCMLRYLKYEKLEETRIISRELQRQKDRRYVSHWEYGPIIFPDIRPVRPVPNVEQLRDMLERAVGSGAQQFNIVFGVGLITEFCYSPSGDSRFVAVGEEFPDSPDPSIFAVLNNPKSQHKIGSD